MIYRHIIPVPPGSFAVYVDSGTANGLWREPLLAIGVGSYDGEADDFFPITLGVEGPSDSDVESTNFLGFEAPGMERSDSDWLAMAPKKP